ncbi:MAG: DNA repair protein RecO [Moraxellaceae bacterium]
MTDWRHAYLLHARPYRETSLLLEFFSAECGRTAAVMRGGRRAQRVPQLFQPLVVDWQGRGELGTVRSLEPAGPALRLSGSLLFSGFYINELLLRLLPRDESLPELFLAYAKALGELAEGLRIEPSLREFEGALLQALGFAIDYAHDAQSGEMVLPDACYAFIQDRGFVPSHHGADAFSGAVLLRIANVPAIDDDVAWHVMKVVHRRCLAHLLGPKPLKSRELFLASR